MTRTRSHSETHESPDPLDRPEWLEYEEFPFDSRVIEIDENQIHFIDEGAGPILLFVHAGPAWSFIFRDVVKELRHDYRCIVLDFPGTGLSDAGDGYVPSLENASAILESFMDALGIDVASAVVHDVGGPVAFGVASRQPERFDGVVIMGSFGWSLNEGFPDVARFIRIVSGKLFGVLNDTLNLLVRLTATKYGVGRRLSRPGRHVFKAPSKSRQSRRYGIAMLGSALESEAYLNRVNTSLRSELSDLPVLLLFGENDESRKAGFQDRWDGLYPTAHTEVVTGANHFPMADAPQFVAHTIDQWHAEAVGEFSG